METWDQVRSFARRLRPLFWKRSMERELTEELAFHIDMEVEMLMRQGRSEAEAKREAMIGFGGVERYKEEVRQARWIRWLDDLVTDVRLALRSLTRYPAFAIAVVVTLALGIGGTTAIFSVVDGLFMRTPEGVRDASQVRKLFLVRDVGSVTTPEGGPGSYLDYEALRDGARSLSGVSAYFGREADLGRGAEAEQIRVAVVTRGYFDVLGTHTARGRFFLAEEDDAQGAYPVVVISHALWQRRFGGASNVLGEQVVINGVPLTIVGVAAKGFVGTEPQAHDAWVAGAMAAPLGLMGSVDSDWRKQEGMAAINYVARLAPGMDDERAITDANAALAHKAESYPDMDPSPLVRTAKLTAASSPWRNATYALSLWLALVAGVVLVIACANVANLVVARSFARRRELALRLSLGAWRSRLVRQSLTESFVLALLGGVAGVLVAHWSRGLLTYFELPPWAGRTDGRLLLFALAVSLVTGLLFGVLPAWRSASTDPLRGMVDTRVAPSLSRSHARRALVALQVSLSLTLLVGTGLVVRSLSRVTDIDMGVDANRLVFVNIDLKKAGFTRAEAEEFWLQAQQRVRQLPGVQSAAMIHFAPFVGMSYGTGFTVPGQKDIQFEQGPQFNLAGPGYFSVAGARMVHGREFEPRDATGEPAVIINETFARKIAPDGNAVGMCIEESLVSAGTCSRIIGVVEDYRTQLLSEPRTAMLFMMRDRKPNAIAWGGPSLLVRTSGESSEHIDDVHAAIASMRSDLPFVNARPLMENLRRDLLPFQLGATLFSMFSVLALALAAVGLYGVLGYFVTERRPEIGIRRSLGAPAGNVILLVVRQSLTPVALGLLIGLAVALAGTRFLGSLLFGIEARDPVAFGVAVMFLVLVAAVATLVPAVRAARVDPMVALRAD